MNATFGCNESKNYSKRLRSRIKDLEAEIKHLEMSLCDANEMIQIQMKLRDMWSKRAIELGWGQG